MTQLHKTTCSIMNGNTFCDCLDLSWIGKAYLKMKKSQDKENTINHPSHYLSSQAQCQSCSNAIECIDVTQNMAFCLGNAIKYIWRCDHKGSAIEDLKKAIWYLEREIKNREKK